MEPVLVSRDGPVATVTLNNPAKLNALNKPLWEALGAAMRELSADDALRCVVLRGAGDQAFAAGAPLVARWRKQFIERMTVTPQIPPSERDAGFACFDTADYRAGVAAFLAKRKPQFEGR
jgi:enoyl-CoA hydratase/carnithine racemase